MATEPSSLPVNYYEPVPWSNEQHNIWGMVISFLIVSWLCAIFRFYVRFFKPNNGPGVGWDDAFLALTVITMTAESISTCLSVHYGLGQHIYLVDPNHVQSYLITFYISNGCYNLATSFIKLGLLFQYLRIFDRGTFPYRAAQILIVFTALWSTAYCFLAWFPCFPVKKIWLADAVEGGVCYGYGAQDSRPFVATYISHGAINVLLDVLTLLVPVPILWRKTTERNDRWRIGGLFAIGAIVLAIAGWRLQGIVAHQAATSPVRDPTWYAPITFILAAVEVNVAAVCSSIPVFWREAAKLLGWEGIWVTKEFDVSSVPRGGKHGNPHMGSASSEELVSPGDFVGAGAGAATHHSQVAAAEAVYMNGKTGVLPSKSAASMSSQVPLRPPHRHIDDRTRSEVSIEMGERTADYHPNTSPRDHSKNWEA